MSSESLQTPEQSFVDRIDAYCQIEQACVDNAGAENGKQLPEAQYEAIEGALVRQQNEIARDVVGYLLDDNAEAFGLLASDSRVAARIVAIQILRRFSNPQGLDRLDIAFLNLGRHWGHLAAGDGLERDDERNMVREMTYEMIFSLQGQEPVLNILATEQIAQYQREHPEEAAHSDQAS